MESKDTAKTGETTNGEGTVKGKHTTLQDTNKTEQQTIEQVKGKNVIASPFISQMKTWEKSDDFQIPKDILANIVDNCKFLKPSIIQGVSIPMISSEPYHSLIAQAKNGSGKTGSFVIGSTLRVDRDNKAIQVICMVNVRELCNQIAAVYEKVCQGTGIEVCNTMTSSKPAQIMVTTHGKLEQLTSGRKSLDLKQLKCFVIDEADVFFLDDKNHQSLKNIVASVKKSVPAKEDGSMAMQWILFSATFQTQEKERFELFQQRQQEIIGKTQQIMIKPEKLQLNHIQQYHMECQKGKKLDFIKDVFETCESTQTFIFVNSKDFAEKIHNLLRKANFKSFIMFAKMTKEERDSTIEQFRNQEIHVLITTNLIARGIDVPETQLVINYDVPSIKFNNQSIADPEIYQHRIGRTGRFGQPGIALTIYDRDVDKQHLDDIVNHYNYHDKMKELKGPEHLQQLLKELNNEDA